jgi:acetyltransferase
MERAGVPMFNDVEEMAEAAGLLARYPALREGTRNIALRDILPASVFHDRKRATS